jgi:MFS transporter, MHS family, proline/betaine transporter
VQGAVATAPLSEAFNKYRRETWLGFGVTVHNTVAYYMALVYMTSYMSSIGRVSQRAALWIGTTCLAIFVLLLPLMGLLSDYIGRRPLLITSCIGYIVLGYPFFWLATAGYVELAGAAQLLMVVFYAPYAGASPALYAEIFPTRVRYTALSIGCNIAVAIFGGFAPFIATFLGWVTGNNRAPAMYVVAAALVTLVFLLRTRETAFAPLR